MKKPIFIDTSYFLALINHRDKYYDAARQASLQVKPPFVTSEAILFELGNTLSHPPARMLGIQVLRQIRQNVDIEIVPITTSLFDSAFSLFSSRLDKAWGLTDCSSFVIMKEMGLTKALTADQHFEQAGFIRLLPKL